MDGIKEAISDLDDDAINNEFAGENLPENIIDLFPDGMLPAEKETVFNESVVFMFCRGFPCCLLEASFAVSSGQDIKEVILEELRKALDGIDPNSDDERREADLRCAMADIESVWDDELRCFGTCVGLSGDVESGSHYSGSFSMH